MEKAAIRLADVVEGAGRERGSPERPAQDRAAHERPAPDRGGQDTAPAARPIVASGTGGR
jgi:hypothetical protein